MLIMSTTIFSINSSISYTNISKRPRSNGEYGFGLKLDGGYQASNRIRVQTLKKLEISSEI